nr:BMP family ABC transporter substrate-binding protein [Ignavibacteria bacterium]
MIFINKSSRLNLFKIILTSVLLFAVSCGKKENQSQKIENTTPLKVGLVFDIGGRGDKSFNDAAYKGLVEAKEKLGVDFEVIDPGDGSDRESALRKLASKKEIGLIFGVGFIFTDDINNIAGEFPDKKFACIDYSVVSGKKIPDNISAIEFKEEEGSFLVGAIAGYNTKTGKVGFLGGMESSLIRKFENGYIQGVKYANPECVILSGY